MSTQNGGPSITKSGLTIYVDPANSNSLVASGDTPGDVTLNVKASNEFINNIRADSVKPTDPVTIKNSNNSTAWDYTKGSLGTYGTEQDPYAQTTAIFNNDNVEKNVFCPFKFSFPYLNVIVFIFCFYNQKI
jgi:hypothetical protein